MRPTPKTNKTTESYNNGTKKGLYSNHLDYTIGQESYIDLSTADFLVQLFTAFESVSD